MGYLFSYWFKFSGGVHNVGDELGPYIISKLSGLKVRYIYVNDVTFKNFIWRFLRIIKRSISEREIKLNEFKTYFLSLLMVKKYIISAGSIIQYAATEKAVVWGSGINYPEKKVKQAEFRAVRGPLTLKLLRECRLSTDGVVIGDPALLLPLIYTPKSPKRYNLGIIAHLAHETYIRENCTNGEIQIISMNNENIEDVLEDINKCKATISSSLHGIIISHAYNIPCIWFEFPGDIGGEKNIKFSDYFLSVGISPYEGYQVEAQNLNNSYGILNTIQSNPHQALPQSNINEMQKNLLRVAPFELVKIYKYYLHN
jgi:pyruvyltransferase